VAVTFEDTDKLSHNFTQLRPATAFQGRPTRRSTSTAASVSKIQDKLFGVLGRYGGRHELVLQQYSRLV